MARIRDIKPEFFLDEELATLSIPARLCFVGLWTIADKLGRLEDRPARIGAQLFPYDRLDAAALLHELAEAGFITRYAVGRIRCIEIRSFRKHQRPHPKEAESILPGPDGARPAPEWLEPALETASREKERQAVEGLDPAAEGDNLPGTFPPGSSGSSGSSGSLGTGSSGPLARGSGDLAPRACDPSPPVQGVILGNASTPPTTEVPGMGRWRIGLTGQLLLDTFNRLREDIIPGSVGWHMAGAKLFGKANDMARTFDDAPEATFDIEPTMRLVLERGRDSQDARDSDPPFAFGRWVSSFTALREELLGRRPPARASPVGRDITRGHAAPSSNYGPPGEQKL